MTPRRFGRRILFVVAGLVAGGLVVALLAACGSSNKESRTQLTMVALNSSVGRAVFHLSCGPVGGDIPSAVTACAALGSKPQLVTRPKPFVCAGGTFSWWDVTIDGRLNGKTVHRSFSTCWTPQMTTIGRFGIGWSVLQRHLVARRHVSVLPGLPRTFAAGVLRATDLVTCDILGHHLEAGVPVERGQDAKETTGFGGAGVVSVALTVAHNSDGSVTASCRRRS